MSFLTPFPDLSRNKGGDAAKGVRSQLACNFFVLHQNGLLFIYCGSNELSFVILRELLSPELHHLKTLLLVPYYSNPSSYNRIGGQNCTKTSWLVYLMVFTVPQHQLKIEEPIFHWWDALEVPLLVFSLGAKSHIRSFASWAGEVLGAHPSVRSKVIIQG